ncbi:MAG: ATP-binding cassette domain-containing protein [Candidatus Cloacimonetes bacterium]|jgi:putative ABC transport system ATP-binding protein|nr:ATP-binding cassette domain-containing protein [Candidatus Cloacimonadota bacterium]MDD4155202.1 ATP-binding cassette domain-containing protein [Candidatus Cloacimonadota bacterium]
MIKIENLSKTFYKNTVNEVNALKNINLEIKQGSFTAVIGTNGSGKSTLLNAIAGTFFLDEGDILLDNQNITNWQEYKRAKYIGRVFQDPFAGTAAEMSIIENIVLAMKRGKSHNLSLAVSKHIKEEISERVKMLKMGLESRLENPIGTLSGGQRQALTLLMATWIKPKLLLLDEHTAALDPKSAAKIAELTKYIIETENLTAMMVTHSMQQAIDLPDRIIMMHKGQIVKDYQAENKKRIRIPDLMNTFDIIQKKELFDDSVIELMLNQYC